MQVGLSYAKGANQTTQFLHLIDLLHIIVAVADLAYNLVLLRHEFKLISHVLDFTVKLWHVLM